MKFNHDNFARTVKNNAGLILTLIILFASRSTFADWYLVPSGSMQPTIVEGDRIFVNKMAYRLELPFTDIKLLDIAQPKRGDIIVFNSKAANNRLVKRLIGLPGDIVTMSNNQLIINGTLINYQAKNGNIVQTENLLGKSHQVQFIPTAQAMDSFSAVTIPDGYYLVLGDNRNNSADSRVHGLVPASEIQGKAIGVVVSLDAEKYYMPRQERFFSKLI